MQIDTDGLVIMERQVGERPADYGAHQRGRRVACFLRGGLSCFAVASSPPTQLLCYSRFLIYKGRDKYIIDDAQPVEVFLTCGATSGACPLPSISVSSPVRWLHRRLGQGDFLPCFCGLFLLIKSNPPICLSRRRWKCGCCPWRVTCPTWSVAPVVPAMRRKRCYFCREVVRSIAIPVTLR